MRRKRCRLPSNGRAPYDWLRLEQHPAILVQAVKLLGTREAPAGVNNPVIMAWAQEVGGAVEDVFKADEIPWCGLFMAVCCKRAGLETPPHPLWALSWAAWGHPVDVPMLGDVLTFVRPGGGHVGLYVGEDDKAFHMLGGNQGDAVSVARIAKARHYATRRTVWKVAQPDNVRRVLLKPSGNLSINEA